MTTMKKNLIYIAAALLLAGCTKDAATEVSQMTGGEPILTVAAGVSAGRTTVSTTEQGLLDIDWAEDDQIGLYAMAGEQQTGRNVSYTAMPNAEDAAHCTFAATNEGEVLYWNGNKQQSFYAYYPFTAVEGALPNAAAQPISLPATQVQAKGNSVAHLAKYGVLTAAPVVFEPNATLSSGICFNFTNLFSVVEFRLKTDAACPLAELPIKSLTLSANGVALAAPVATMDLTQSPTVIATEEVATALQLDLAEEVGLKRDGYTSFYMLVLPGTHAAKSLLLEVTAIDNSVHAVSIAEGVTFRSNKHYVREYELTIDGFVAADAFEAEIPSLTTKVGEPLTVNFSGKATSVDFWSGEYGHEYAYATKDRMEDAAVKINFWSLLCNGTQPETATIKYSTDFDGTMTEDAILAATWTDVKHLFNWPTVLHTNDSIKTAVPDDSGLVDITEWFDGQGKSVYVAFFYHVKKPDNRTFFMLFDSWVKAFYTNSAEELYIQKFATENNNKLNVKIVNEEGTNNPLPTFVLGSSYTSSDNQTLSLRPVKDQSTAYPYHFRIGAAFSKLTVDKDAWFILPKLTLPERKNVGPDKPFVVHTADAETPATWSYTFNAPGTYKVSIVGTVTTLAGDKQVVKEATVTVTE